MQVTEVRREANGTTNVNSLYEGALQLALQDEHIACAFAIDLVPCAGSLPFSDGTIEEWEWHPDECLKYKQADGQGPTDYQDVKQLLEEKAVTVENPRFALLIVSEFAPRGVLPFCL